MATGGERSISKTSEFIYDFFCSNCDKDGKHTEGDRFCVECAETFCTPCLACHNKIAAMRHHELIGKAEMSTRGPTQDSLPLPNSRCAVHPDEIVKMYCLQDDVVCCTVCIAEDHRLCGGVVHIPKAAKNIKTSHEFQDVNAAMESMRADINMLKKGKKLDLDRVTKQHVKIQASISKLRKHINTHLDRLEASINSQLEIKFKEHETEFNKISENLDIQLLEMAKTAAMFKDAQNESQLFVDIKEAKKKNKEDRKLIDDADKSVGKAAILYEPNKELSKVLEIKSFGVLDDQKTFTSVSHLGDFSIKTLNDKRTCDIAGSCQMLDGNVVITDQGNEKLKLLDRSYNIIAECNLPCPSLNMCRTRPTEIAISLCAKKEVLFAEVTDKISLKGSFSVSEACHGIAYNEGLLYVACGGYKDLNEGPGQVQVYDRAGNLLQTFIKDKHKKKLFSIPRDIVVSECRTLLHIADGVNGIITMNLDGTGPWKLTNPDMENPWGICVMNNDDLIVSGLMSHNMILFDKKGQQKAILLKEKDGIENPQSVLYDRPNSRLIVSMLRSNLIKVFNLL